MEKPKKQELAKSLIPLPAQAAFTSATVTSGPATSNSVTRKSYVDNTATVLSIALGA